MPGTDALGRTLVVLGLILLVVGGSLLLAGRLPGIGRLPGDLYIQRDGFSVYVPIVTMLLLSVVLTVLLNLVGFVLRR